MASTRRAAAGLALALVAGCGFQPVGTFDRAEYLTQAAAEGRHELTFLPHSTELAPDERARLAGFFQALGLGAGDDVLLTFVSSGAIELDRQRVAAASRAVEQAAILPRVQIVNRRERDRTDVRPNVVLVEALRSGQLLVACPRRHRDVIEQEFATWIPPMGCANAANLAHHAESLRDLTDPRVLRGSESATSVAALRRHRTGQVIHNPISLGTSR